MILYDIKEIHKSPRAVDVVMSLHGSLLIISLHKINALKSVEKVKIFNTNFLIRWRTMASNLMDESC